MSDISRTQMEFLIGACREFGEVYPKRKIIAIDREKFMYLGVTEFYVLTHLMRQDFELIINKPTSKTNDHTQHP